MRASCFGPNALEFAAPSGCGEYYSAYFQIGFAIPAGSVGELALSGGQINFEYLCKLVVQELTELILYDRREVLIALSDRQASDRCATAWPELKHLLASEICAGAGQKMPFDHLRQTTMPAVSLTRVRRVNRESW